MFGCDNVSGLFDLTSGPPEYIGTFIRYSRAVTRQEHFHEQGCLRGGNTALTKGVECQKYRIWIEHCGEQYSYGTIIRSA